jgi:hypothetical protein
VTLIRVFPPEPLLDHLVYAVPDLDAAASTFTASTGIAPAPGGRHLGRGTRNLLVGLGRTAYLEIIGPDQEHPADPGAVVPFGIDGLTGPRLVTWAVQPADIEAAVAAAAAAGADLGEPAPMSRRTPDGARLSWRLAAPHPAPFDGITPFLIDWGTTAHPAGVAGLPALGLRGLGATHPDPDGVRAVLDAPGLAALLDTPRGPVVLC